MVEIKESYRNFSKSYLFTEIEKRILRHGGKDLINLGVGDVSLPLVPTVKKAIIAAVEEMSKMPIGYGPTDGYLVLKKTILEKEYPKQSFSPEEIFITDGISSAITQINSLFPKECSVGIIDPAYPAYYDASFLEEKSVIKRLPCLEENGFIPQPPKEKLDLVYLCSPHNPTGTALTYSDLQMWVDWAKKHKSLLLFDAAYHAFIQSKDVPKTIYEIEGAREVALEFRSFSKAAGFTGLRLGYLVLPSEIGLAPFWKLHLDVYTNGFAYPIQRGAIASLSLEGIAEIHAQINTYLETTRSIKRALLEQDFTIYGGDDIPFLWWKVSAQSSWHAFDSLLADYGIICIPGTGFGDTGEGYVRLCGFLSPKDLEEALSRLSLIPIGAI